MGGWALLYPALVGGIPRELHAWQDLNDTDHLAIGTTVEFDVLTDGVLQGLTPQTVISNFAPAFTTHIGSPTIEITDPNIANVTTFDSVFFNTPVSVGGLILSGLYPIIEITGTHSYQITAAASATTNVTNGGSVPVFTTSPSNSVVAVKLNNSNLATGNVVIFQIPTTGNGVTINGSYTVTAAPDINDFNIQGALQATAGSSFPMNGGNAQLVYYIALGPPAAGSGYGLGGYGLGGFGTGVTNPNQIGTPISATDWTIDNWGQIVLACPADGAIYFWDPTGGFANLSPVSGAPVFNSGMFVSSADQILVAYGTSITGPGGPAIGVQADPLLVSWSDSGNFFDWIPTDANFAGNFRLSNGSQIRGGLSVAQNNLIWTDIDCWIMNFIGQPDVYGFNKIGAGAGLASRHAMQPFRGSVHWMGLSNFYRYDGGGVTAVPCPVWDAVFQNLNLAFAANIRAMPNTPFNEVGYFYPSLASTSGENDSYVKYNVNEPGAPWDIGPIGAMQRSAWIDQSSFGASPISASSAGQIFQQETTADAAGAPLLSRFRTGYFFLSEGEDFVSIDRVLPDFIWGTYAGPATAQIQMTFYVVNYPGDTPQVFGPYTVMQGTEYITVRFRGRQIAIEFASSDLGSFWRIGRVRFRYSPMGRR